MIVEEAPTIAIKKNELSFAKLLSVEGMSESIEFIRGYADCVKAKHCQILSIADLKQCGELITGDKNFSEKTFNAMIMASRKAFFDIIVKNVVNGLTVDEIVFSD